MSSTAFSAEAFVREWVGEASQSKLLPCPFCGKTLERSADLSTRRQDHYTHPALADGEDYCMIQQVHVVDYLDDRHHDQSNVERWNRRATDLGEAK